MTREEAEKAVLETDLRNGFMPIIVGPREADSHTVAVNVLLQIALGGIYEPHTRIQAACAILNTKSVPSALLPVLVNQIVIPKESK